MAVKPKKCNKRSRNNVYVTKEDMELADKGHDVIKIIEKYGGCGKRDTSHLRLISRLRFHIYRHGRKHEKSLVKRKFNKLYAKKKTETTDKEVNSKSSAIKSKDKKVNTFSNSQSRHASSAYSASQSNQQLENTINSQQQSQIYQSPIIRAVCNPQYQKSSFNDSKFLQYLQKRFYLTANAQKYVQVLMEKFEKMLKGEKEWKSSLQKRKTQKHQIIEQVDRMIKAHQTKAEHAHHMSIRKKLVKFIRDVDLVISSLKQRNSNLEKTMAEWIALNRKEKQEIFQIIQQSQKKEMMRVVQLRDLQTWYRQKLHLLSLKEQEKMKEYINKLEMMESKRFSSMESLLQKYTTISGKKIEAVNGGYEQYFSQLQSQNRYLWAINTQQSKQLEYLSRLLLDQIIPAHKEEIFLMKQNMRKSNTLEMKLTSRRKCPKCPPPFPPILVPKPVFINRNSDENKSNSIPNKQVPPKAEEEEERNISFDNSNVSRKKLDKKQNPSYDKYLSDELAKTKLVSKRLEKESKEAIKHISKCVHHCPSCNSQGAVPNQIIV